MLAVGLSGLLILQSAPLDALASGVLAGNTAAAASISASIGAVGAGLKSGSGLGPVNASSLLFGPSPGSLPSLLAAPSRKATAPSLELGPVLDPIPKRHPSISVGLRSGGETAVRIDSRARPGKNAAKNPPLRNPILDSLLQAASGGRLLPAGGAANRPHPGVVEGRMRFDGGGEPAPAVDRVNSSRVTTAVAIMLAGSMMLSRTNLLGRRVIAEDGLSTAQVQATAERNFRTAAEWVANNAADLRLNRATVIALNRILTRNLLDDAIAGDPDYRADSAPFFRWLETEVPQVLESEGPEELAYRIHFKLTRMHGFPDANARTARLLADLVLLQNGLAPAMHTSLKGYFEKGTGVSRRRINHTTRRSYWHEAIALGQRMIAHPEMLARYSTPSAEDIAYLEALRADPNHGLKGRYRQPEKDAAVAGGEPSQGRSARGPPSE